MQGILYVQYEDGTLIRRLVKGKSLEDKVQYALRQLEMLNRGEKVFAAIDMKDYFSIVFATKKALNTKSDHPILRQEDRERQWKKAVREFLAGEQKVVTAMWPMFEISYYARVGEHGGHGKYLCFERALEAAKRFLQRSDIKKEIKEGDLWYVGVEGHASPRFVILYVNESYVSLIDSRESFGHPTYKEVWMDAANRFLKTGKVQTSKYPAI